MSNPSAASPSSAFPPPCLSLPPHVQDPYMHRSGSSNLSDLLSPGALKPPIKINDLEILCVLYRGHPALLVGGTTFICSIEELRRSIKFPDTINEELLAKIRTLTEHLTRNAESLGMSSE